MMDYGPLSMVDAADRALAERLRAFNRFYTEAIGSLDDHHEGLKVSLAQSRLLFTTASLDRPQVSQIADALGLDLAYTSRILGTLEDAGHLGRTVSRTDRRQRVVALTARGRRTLDEIERRSNSRMLALVAHLDDHNIDELFIAMNTIKRLLRKEDTNGQQD
jgi:DNA-binding MarR family transcriptional regulator